MIRLDPPGDDPGLRVGQEDVVLDLGLVPCFLDRLNLDLCLMPMGHQSNLTDLMGSENSNKQKLFVSKHSI